MTGKHKKIQAVKYYPNVTRQKNWPPKVGKEYCTEFSTPAIASQLANEIAPGAVLKHVIDERYRAILIDWVGSGPEAVAVVVYTEDDKLSKAWNNKKQRLDNKPYRVRLIDLNDWICLTLGQDEEMLVP